MLHLGSIQLDLDHHRVLRSDGEESLTQLEVDALRYLLERSGQVVTRARLESDVWRFGPGVQSEAVPVAMRRLRRKLGEGVLATVRGSGWRLDGPGLKRAAPRLPTFATPFVGRDELLGEIHARLAGEWHLVTLRGPGGVGKTRAAVELAATWPGEVVAVSLLGTPPGADALASLLADALGLAHGGAAALRRGLAARDRPLLVLDDADATAGAIAPLLGQLVRDVPSVRVLVTSRVALGIPEEAMLEVPPFGPTLARAFLVDRLRGVHPDPEAEEEALDLLVEALDGLPASLELYAGRAWFGLGPLVRELRAGRQDSTLDAQVQRSWDALDDAQREVLLACSAFAGTFPTEAASAASGGRMHLLAELRRRSLVQLDPGGQLFMLATVRRFCEQQPDAGWARRRARAWVLERAEAACEGLVRRPADSLRALRVLRPHLLEVARTAPPLEAARAVLTTSAALACTGPTTLRLELLESIDWAGLPAPLGHRGRVDLARARRMAGVPVAEVAGLIEGLRGAEVALLRGDHAVATGERDLALASYAEAVALAPEDHWVNPVARARRCAPASLVTLRPPAEVDEDLARALGACERHGMALHLPEILRAAGTVCTSRGDLPRARAHLGRALQLAESAGLHRLVGDLWNALGVAWYLESTLQAEACFERALTRANEQGDEGYAAIYQLNLAGTRVVHERPEDALRLLELAGQVLRNRVARQACDLHRAGALYAVGRDLDARVVLETVEPPVVGALYSPRAALHGELLVRFMAAEARLRVLAEAPDLHGPPLRALLADAAEERQLPSAVSLRVLAERLERRLAEVGQARPGGPTGSAT